MSSVPLPFWNDGATKSVIVDFVARITKEGGPEYVRPAERVAVSVKRDWKIVFG